MHKFFRFIFLSARRSKLQDVRAPVPALSMEITAAVEVEEEEENYNTCKTSSLVAPYAIYVVAILGITNGVKGGQVWRP